jgi:hypothetical protein
VSASDGPGLSPPPTPTRRLLPPNGPGSTEVREDLVRSRRGGFPFLAGTAPICSAHQRSARAASRPSCQSLIVRARTTRSDCNQGPLPGSACRRAGFHLVAEMGPAFFIVAIHPGRSVTRSTTRFPPPGSRHGRQRRTGARSISVRHWGIPFVRQQRVIVGPAPSWTDSRDIAPLRLRFAPTARALRRPNREAFARCGFNCRPVKECAPTPLKSVQTGANRRIAEIASVGQGLLSLLAATG